MKNLLRTTALLGLAGLVMSPLNGQTTIIGGATGNGDLESGVLSPWDDSNNVDAATISTTYAQAGTNSLAIDSTGRGAWTSPQVFQADFPSTEGDIWEFSGYMLTPAVIGDDSFGLFKIVFKDAGGGELTPTVVSKGQINTGFPGIESLPFLNSGTTPETWILSEAAGTAPAGTASVTLLVLNVNQGVAPSVMHYDTITAIQTIPSADPPPLPVDVAVNGTDVELTFDTTYLMDYTATTSTGLSGFVPVPDVVVGGSGSPKTMVIPGAAPAAGEKSFFIVDSAPLDRGAVAANEILVNGTLDSGEPAECPNTSNWSAYGSFSKAGQPNINDAWEEICLAPFVVTTPGFATFGMNDQLATDDANYIGASQVMSVYQDFWAPENSLGIRPFHELRGRGLIFSGTADITEAYAAGNTGEVFIQVLDLNFGVVQEASVDISVLDEDASNGTTMDPVTGIFNIQINVTTSNINTVRVGFRNTGIEGTAGEMTVSNLSAFARRSIDFPAFTGEAMRNAGFDTGAGNLEDWEVYATWQGGTIPYVDAPVSADGLGTAVFSVNASNTGDASLQQNFWSSDNPPGVTPNFNLYGQVLTFSGNVQVTEAYSGGNVGKIGLQFLDLGYSETVETTYIEDISDPTVDSDDSDGITFNHPNPGDFSITVTAPSSGLTIIQTVFRNTIITPSGSGGTGQMTISNPSLVAADPAP